VIPFNATTATRHGVQVFHRLDQYVGASLDVYGEFSPDEADFLCALVGPGSVVLDGGANVGALTLPLARRVGPWGRVIAVEPQLLTHQALAGTVALNSLPNVITVHAALGKASGAITVPSLDLGQVQNVGGFSVQGHAAGLPVRQYTVDDLLRFLRLPGLSLLKLDVEGMERDVLAGATETLRRCQPILYCEADREDARDGLLADMKRLGYRTYWHRPPLYRRANFRGERRNIFLDTQGRPVLSFNVLGLPKHDTRDVGLEAA
jgi:FkbM family methyltransferase